MPPLQKMFDAFPPSRLGQLAASMVVCAAVGGIAGVRDHLPLEQLVGICLYGGCIGLVAGLILTFARRRHDSTRG